MSPAGESTLKRDRKMEIYHQLFDFWTTKASKTAGTHQICRCRVEEVFIKIVFMAFVRLGTS
ncbi:hypothetical protein KY285_035432 [Solanum tuberosum]|nr:hypothetical protein KY285_035432 [Solanum tuberosum]